METNFKEVIETEFEKLHGDPIRTDETRSLQKALLENPAFVRGFSNTVAVTAEKFNAVSTGGFADEEEFTHTLTSRGVGGPVMDMLTFGYILGKAVGTAQSLESMFKGPVN